MIIEKKEIDVNWWCPLYAINATNKPLKITEKNKISCCLKIEINSSLFLQNINEDVIINKGRTIDPKSKDVELDINLNINGLCEDDSSNRTKFPGAKTTKALPTKKPTTKGITLPLKDL